MSKSQAIAKKLKHEIKTLRMNSRPNHKNTNAKFDKWSAWKKNNVAPKVAIIKAKIDDLKANDNGNGPPL
jgi:hypothetical protein